MSLFAYLDPGSGSLMVQAVIAGLVGTGFYFRRVILAPMQSFWRAVAGPRNDAP